MINVERIENSVIQFQPQSTAPLSAQVVAERIGSHLNRVGRYDSGKYLFPMSALTQSLALEYGVTEGSRTYGAIVPISTHQADKAMLHVLTAEGAARPDWYIPELAKGISGDVPPGFTVFENSDALIAYERLEAAGFSVRAKDPSANGGGRQTLLDSRSTLEDFLNEYPAISEIGLVLEANTDTITNMPTVGQFNLLDSTYSWISHNFNVLDRTALRFGGTTMQIAEGSHEDLLRSFDLSADDARAIRHAEVALEHYKSSGIRIGRCALDILQGIAKNGASVSGVVDPSLRPSASSVAEIKGVEEIHATNTHSATVKLSFLYDKGVPVPEKAEVFLDHEKLRIAVGVVSS